MKIVKQEKPPQRGNVLKNSVGCFKRMERCDVLCNRRRELRLMDDLPILFKCRFEHTSEDTFIQTTSRGRIIQIMLKYVKNVPADHEQSEAMIEMPRDIDVYAKQVHGILKVYILINDERKTEYTVIVKV